jgi:hypothetical protein
MSVDPETGPHRRVDLRHEEDRESSRWVWWFGVVCAIAFLAVAAVGSVVVIQQEDGAGTSSQLAGAQPTQRAEPSASPEPRETLEATEETSPDPGIDWRAKDAPAQVLAKTKFVARYKNDQAPITRKHPDLGTPDKGLANHGVELCRMIADPNVTLFHVYERFKYSFHDHLGPVNVEGSLLTARLAVAEICPELKPELDRKRRF